MFVLHANWYQHALHVWAESGDAYRAGNATAAVAADQLATHAFIATLEQVKQAAAHAGLSLEGASASVLPLVLPFEHDRPSPSDRLIADLGLSLETDRDLRLEACEIQTLALPAHQVLASLLAYESKWNGEDHQTGHELRFWCAAARFALELIEDQRVVPTVQQDRSGRMDAHWRPWLSDAGTAEKAATLLTAMPPLCRSVADNTEADGWAVLENFLGACVDSFVRGVMVQENYLESIEDRDASTDAHVAWLRGLLDQESNVPQAHAGDVSLVRGARQWLGLLEDIGEGRPMRLLLELIEPLPTLFAAEDGEEDHHQWRLAFSLITTDEPATVIDAETVWKQAAGKGGSKNGAEKTAGLLLSELARASRIWPKFEDALEETSPTGLDLTTSEAYAFLREIRPVIEETGVKCLVPDWWSQAHSRVGARLLIDGDTPDGMMVPAGDGRRGGFGLHSVVNYAWQIALGDQPLSIEAFEALAKKSSPLVRLNGRWVEVRREDLDHGLKFLKQHPGGRMTLLEAMRLAHGAAEDAKGLPILGMDATGWVAEIFGPTHASERLDMVVQPKLFQGTLRPYQLAGLSWLAFLDRYGLGACLADDMGLGKTIQLIALMQHERERAPEGERVGTTLLVCPMSVLGNWHRELTRFAPELTVHLHHGLDRPQGDALAEIVAKVDVVITTYALVARDKEAMEKIQWRRVALDEAQHIKNPPTKQTAAIRSLKSGHRVALTGTPVENRLTELWSIMEFCTPGYLGSMGDFRRRFAVPIERHRDKDRAERLRNLVKPFILRRLKTDLNVISDLPSLVETRQHIPLTGEQATLYDQVVEEMLAKVDRSEGLRRRGLVLSALVKLKQICNHPAHYLREVASPSPVDPVAREAIENAAESLGEVAVNLGDKGRPLSARSGKSIRLMQMLEEVVAAGDRALLFTQYRQMGHLLVAMIRRELDVESMFLHGGTPQAKRDQLVERFQDPAGTAPIFVLSLKAGGVGLNLTAANHVFHYDRWWNPAVENQATDRAFRIGQLRTVNVHKMICIGTLEERIDQMIEQKTELASQIIGAGEQWLTEMSTGQLRDILSLRSSALEEV